MIDWTQSMQQTYEYYVVDVETWGDKERLRNITSCEINRDSTSETLGSATIEITDMLGESYIRCYLIANQNDESSKVPLGTFLVQTPSSKHDGKVRTVSMDCYTPLLELKENLPPIGYYIAKGENVLKYAVSLTKENLRAPVVSNSTDDTLFDDFVANTDDTWLTFNTDLLSYIDYKYDLDEMGRILFAPEQDAASMQPVWTFTDDNCSILYSDISLEHDLYGIPNVVEVIYSDSENNFYAKAINDDSNSPISTINRGRQIVKRISDLSLIGNPTENRIQEYANETLKSLSTVEYTVSYEHGYCPVRVGDCVRFNCKRAGLVDVKAKVISQSIKCEAGCPVTEKASFTMKLWG